MSVVGLDVGNENCIVAVARQRGIDVVLNDESKRETPALVSFNEKQRFIGTAAWAALTMSPKNTVAQVKRLIGRLFRDPEVQQDLAMLPFSATEGPDGSPLIHVQYLGESRAFTPTQVLGMILSNLKAVAEKNLQTNVADCVIGIPVFFRELQRRALLNAAAIADLRPLRLMHETTATALAYGIYRTDLSENDPINVAFVDVGHSSMQACVAAFKKGQLKILGHAFDRSLGGRDFDEVLFRHFCHKFKEEYRMDVLSNARACQRLRAACEKLKKVLSANPEAPLNIECLMEEKDVRGFMKRDDFDQLSRPILERVKFLCERVIAEANIPIDKFYAVEVVGSGSRVPAVLKILSAVFGKEPSRTLNASECIARGCALQCAMLSPTFRVREFEVQDCFPFSVALAWKASAPESEEGRSAGENLTVVFSKGNPIPSTKMLTFYRSSMFTVDVLYADMHDLPLGTSQKINTFTIGPFEASKPGRVKIKVKVCLNLHGIVSVESATMIEEEELEIPVIMGEEKAKGPGAMAMKEASEIVSDGDAVKMETADSNASGPGCSASGIDNGVQCEKDKPTQMEIEISKKDGFKKKTKRKDVPVSETVVGGLLQSDLQKAIEKEYEMALQDRIMEETKDKKNAVESYIYDMRNKLDEKYREYVTDLERQQLMAKLEDAENWLYEDGEDETKGVYIAKLTELKKVGDPIEERFKEQEGFGPCIDQLLYCVNSFREAAMSKDPKFDHIDDTEKEKVINECVKVEEWFKEKRQQQDHLPKAVNPVLLCSDLKRKTEALDRLCKPIMTKARPPPAKPASPSCDPKVAPGKGSDSCSANGNSQPPSEPMDIEALHEE